MAGLTLLVVLLVVFLAVIGFFGAFLVGLFLPIILLIGIPLVVLSVVFEKAVRKLG